MTTYDNAPPLEGWVAPAKHCGLLCFDYACDVCGEYVLPANVQLGDN